MTDSQMAMVDAGRDVEHTRNSSTTEASSTASDSPTPTNSVQDKNWAHWHGPSNAPLTRFFGNIYINFILILIDCFHAHFNQTC